MLMRRRQQIQYSHDQINHFDIMSLSRLDKLKHYGLHFAKYAGRFARGSAEPKSRKETLVDAFLVSLSAANALNQALDDFHGGDYTDYDLSDLVFTSHAGCFADACEKIDHLEDFRSIAINANAALIEWIERSAMSIRLDLDILADERRKQLAQRAVYAVGS